LTSHWKGLQDIEKLMDEHQGSERDQKKKGSRKGKIRTTVLQKNSQKKRYMVQKSNEETGELPGGVTVSQNGEKNGGFGLGK